MESKKNFNSRGNDKMITNFEITRDSILIIVRDIYKLEDVDIECFLNKLSEETLEVILKDISEPCIVEK